MGPAISFCVACTQNTDFGECLLDLLLYAGIILAFFFNVLLTVLLGIIFVHNQLDAPFFFVYVHFYSLHVSGSHVPVIRRNNFINMTSGICYSV